MNKKAELFLFAIFSIFLGVAISATILTSNILEDINPNEEIDNLHLLVEKILNSNRLIEEKISILKKEHEELTKSTINIKDQEILNKLKSELSLGEESGTGIVISMSEKFSNEFNNESVCLASYLRDIKNLAALPELETKALSINNIRLTMKSNINCIGNGNISVDFNRLAPPFEIKIIGKQQRLLNIFNTKRYLPMIWEDNKNNFLKMQIEGKEYLEIPAYSGNMTPKFIIEYIE